MAVSAEEKIRQLIEEETTKRSEIAQKKQELEKKRKEVEALEKQRTQEIKDARKEVQSKIEELVLEERKNFEEQEELKRRREEQSIEGLEEKITAQEVTSTGTAVQVKGYAEAISELMAGKSSFYNVTNYNIINRLESIATQATNRPLTKDEEEFVRIVEYHATNLSQDDYYKDKQGINYLKKELAQIDFINKLAKGSSGGESQGNYNV
jgi:hypothetical protein